MSEGHNFAHYIARKRKSSAKRAFVLEIIYVLNLIAKTKHCIVDLNSVKGPINYPGFNVFFCLENSSSQCSNQNQIKVSTFWTYKKPNRNVLIIPFSQCTVLQIAKLSEKVWVTKLENCPLNLSLPSEFPKIVLKVIIYFSLIQYFTQMYLKRMIDFWLFWYICLYKKS